MTNPLDPNFNVGVGRLTADRFDFQDHIDGYSLRHKASAIDLFPTVVISSTTYTNVQDVIVALKNALTIPILPDATTLTKGAVQLAGDIGGTASSVSVLAIHGFPVAATPPTLNYVLTWTGSNWAPGSVSAAFTFAGDVTGTAGATTVVKINGKPVSAAVPNTNDVLKWNGTTWTPSASVTAPTGTGFATVTSSSFDAAATTNIRYASGKFQSDVSIQFKNGANLGDLAWVPTTTRTLSLPDATDTLVGQATTDTLTNKTINVTNNSLIDTGITTGDLLVATGGKFLRKPQGANNTFWGVSGGVAGYYTPSGITAVGGTGFVTATSGAIDGTATANIRYSSGGHFQTDSTFSLQFKNGASIGDLSWTPSTNRALTLPDATDTLVGKATTDTLTNKTINATNNTITDTGITNGDILAASGGKFLRFAQGGNGTFLGVSGGVLGYFTPAAGGSSTGAVNTVQLSNGSGGFLAATNVLGGTSFLSIGTTPSTTGFLRVPNGTTDTILGAKDSGGTDVNVISRPATNTFLFGNQSNQAAVVLCGSTTDIQSNAQIRMFAPSDVSNPALKVSGVGQVQMNPHAFQGFICDVNASTNGALLRFFGGVSGLEPGASAHLELGNAANPPANTPTGGGYMYVSAGSLKYRGTSGTLTTLAPADPHCKKCGRDFMHEWENPNYGKLNTCMPCLLDALEILGIDVNAFSDRQLKS